jgi:predicted Zn finger-like uncharacterized protein
MDVTCNACGAKLKIADSKLPPAHMLLVTVTCPKCKKKIIIDRRESTQKPPPQKQAVQPVKGPQTDKRAVVTSGKEPPAQKEAAAATVQAAKAQTAPAQKKAGAKPELKRIPEERTEIDPEKAAALKKMRDMQQAAFDYEEDIADLLLSLEEGAKLSLILVEDSNNRKELKSVVEELSFKAITPKSVREAMGRLLFHHFDLIILSEGFEGLDLEDTPIVHYLNHISMNIRRRIFLVLLSEKFKTMDNMEAFGWSANLVVNTDDISNISLILKKALSDHEKFYKIFMDTLQEVGKR